MPLYMEWPLGILKLCFQVRRRDTVGMMSFCSHVKDVYENYELTSLYNA